MKCSLRGCPGELEQRVVTHAVHRGDELFVIDHVPAEVCSVCGDTLLTAEAVQRIEDILQGRAQPSATVPVYEYAS
ncbi:MAG TPA: type II toxin-antitoxin system MqsA family antitoxin [Vicinamibacteria bacterium]|nr:type II toxin-antitoxin system MqsA family antitoxin [Vicinamibacteria bacterium]